MPIVDVKDMAHHSLRVKDFEHQCLYCGADVSAATWKSDFHLEIHYKHMTCDCGKPIRFTVDFHGSGHDHMSDKKKKDSLDGIVEE